MPQAVWIFAFALLAFGCFAQKRLEEPQAFSLSGSAAALRLQESLYGYEEIVTGEVHHFERWIYDEQQKIIQYHNSTFQIRRNFINLEHKKRVVEIKCSQAGQPAISIGTTKKLDLKVGDFIYFQHHWKSGCYRHHNNGDRAVNLFQITAVSTTDTVAAGTIRPANVEEIFDFAHLKTYYEHLNSDHSRKMSGLGGQQYDENNDDEDQEVFNFRKRNLSPEGFDFVTALHRFEHKRGYSKRSFWSSIGNAFRRVGSAISNVARRVGGAIVNTAKRVGSAIVNTAKKVGNAVVNTAKTVGNAVVNAAKAVGNFVSKEAMEIYNKLKSLGSFEVSKTISTTINLKSGSKTFGGILTVSAGVSVTPSFTIDIQIQTFRLNKLLLGLVGTVTGTISASLAKQISKSKSWTLFSVNSPPLDIPTPIPGLFITVQAQGSLTATLDAELNVAIDLGSLTASGSVGCDFQYSGGSWSTTPVKSFSVQLTPPQINDISASIGLTLTPMISLELGVSAADIITVAGGPTLGIPLEAQLKGSLTSSCALELVITWGLTVGVEIQLEVFDITMLSSKPAQKQVAGGTIYDKCLIDGSKTQGLVNSINNQLGRLSFSKTWAPTSKKMPGFFGASRF